ncbi:hypothetical protein DM02DRAFT_179895 [Periconia macrospinosa]|uniref:Ribonuclease H2 subunit B n=1 Tax=Periconia macrospinosa TaxID=97972 RepID=A0A2V1DB99_9PLEO|nr:hypothetical protein DM02DRAFT_179895 [Periconia macrospinosa]
MARTRSKPAPAAATAEELESTTEVPTATAKSVPPPDKNRPKLFLLPKDTSEDSRIVTLDNPATGAPSRYYFCPEKGFYEFTRIAAPKKDCRSWLITSEESLASKESGNGLTTDSENVELGTGYVVQAANLFIATPIDLLFLILPVLAPKNMKETEQHFLELFDHLEALSTASRQWKALFTQYPSLKAMIEKKMVAICDTVSVGDDTMYRISQEKLLALLLKKAERVCKNGLPPSLENKFIKTALEVPIMNIKREESSLTVVSENPDSQLSTTATAIDSQSSTETVSTAATSVIHEEVIKEEFISTPSLVTPPEIPRLLRLRTALRYLASSYLPSTLRTSIQTLLQSSNLIDFTPLDTHLAAVAKLRSEAAALRSISDNISRKRGLEEDDEKIAEREEKKRKKEEEEKKKKTESRGIKQLKKADTSGMKKMSSFFTKLPKKT